MKISTMIVIFGLILLAIFCFSRAIAGETEKPEQIYESDLAGVLGPGSAHDLEIKKKESYLSNLYLKHPDGPMHVDIGEDYQIYIGEKRVWGGLKIIGMEVLYYVPDNMAFVFTFGEGIHIEKHDGRRMVKVSWDKMLYEHHLDQAYLQAVVQYPSLGHPFVEWYKDGGVE